MDTFHHIKPNISMFNAITAKPYCSKKKLNILPLTKRE